MYQFVKWLLRSLSRSYNCIVLQMIKKQGDDLKRLRIDHELIDDFRHMEMIKILEEFYNLQGNCERINQTPIPRQFGYFSKVFTWIFILLIPFGLLGEFEKLEHNYMWLTIPFYVLIAWIFITMELVGDNIEDPFENFVNDVPIMGGGMSLSPSICRRSLSMTLVNSVAPVNDVLM